MSGNPDVEKAGGKKAQSRTTTAVREALSKYDRDGNGQIDAGELAVIVEDMVAERRERRRLWFLIIALSVAVVVMVGATCGLTYAVVAALKDTKVEGGSLVSKDTGEVLRVGAADFGLNSNGVLAPRNPDGTLSTVPIGVGTLKAVSLADLTDADLDMAHFLQVELNTTTITLCIEAVVRTPAVVDARSRNVVKPASTMLYTSKGTFLLANNTITPDLDPAFEAQLLQRVDPEGGRRRLLAGGATSPAFRVKGLLTNRSGSQR